MLPCVWGGLDSKGDFGPWMWGVFFGGILHSPVDGSVESCVILISPSEKRACPLIRHLVPFSLFFCRQIFFFFFCIKNYVCNLNKIGYKPVPIYYLSCRWGTSCQDAEVEREQLAMYLFKSLLL